MELSRKLQHVRKLMISAGINSGGIWEVDDLDKGIVVLAVRHSDMPDRKGDNPRFDKAVKGLKIDVSDKSIHFSEGSMNPTVISIGTPKARISQMMESPSLKAKRPDWELHLVDQGRKQTGWKIFRISTNLTLNIRQSNSSTGVWSWDGLRQSKKEFFKGSLRKRDSDLDNWLKKHKSPWTSSDLADMNTFPVSALAIR